MGVLMLSLSLSPYVVKLLGIGIVVTTLVGIGYYKGYTSEHKKLLQYKSDIEAQVKQQDILLQTRVKQEQIKTEGIINAYKAKLHTLRGISSGGLQYNTDTLQLSETPSTQGAITSPSYPVLVGQCLETTLMLTSLQEWVKSISED